MTGDEMRLWRLSVGWTQAKLAERLGVTIGTVSRWENGSPIPHLVVLALDGLRETALSELM